MDPTQVWQAASDAIGDKMAQQSAENRALHQQLATLIEKLGMPAPAARRRRTTDIDKFDGTGDYLAWRLHMEAVYNLDQEYFGSEKAAVHYLFAQLTGDATPKMLPWMQATPDPTVDGFMAKMDSTYRDPHYAAKQYQLLVACKQGHRPFRDFYSEWSRYLAQAGAEVNSEQAQMRILKEALNPELRRLVRASLYNIQTLAEMVNRIREAADDEEPLGLYGGSTRGWNRTPRTGGVQPQQQQQMADVMDWEPTSRAARSHPLAGKRAKWVSRDEISRRRQNGLCFRCGGTGHRVPECPLAPAQNPGVITRGPTIRRMEFSVPDDAVEEEPQGNA